MILSQIRTTIRDRVRKLGYKEWEFFSSDTPPNTVIEKYFHVGVSGGSGSSLSMHVLKIPSDVTITIWTKGYRAAVEAQDAGLASIQEVLCDLLNPVVRTLPAYRKIDLNSYTLEPVAIDNDHICKISINLNVETILEVTQTVES